MTASAYGASIWQFSMILNECLTKALKPIVKRYNLTQSQAQLLFSVHRNEVSTVGSLAQKLGLARTNASAMCKKLASMGFIKRHRKEDDERVVTIALTETGANAAREIESRIEKIYHKKCVELKEIERMIFAFQEISDLLTEDE